MLFHLELIIFKLPEGTSQSIGIVNIYIARFHVIII